MIKGVGSVSKTVCIRLMGDVNDQSAAKLTSLVEQKLKEDMGRLVLLISSTGGLVFQGLSAYNYLKGLPVEVVTHNFGSVDSVALVLYCAGSRRLSVSHARFLVHGVTYTLQARPFEEKQLEEILKRLQMDEENIAGIIAANSGKSEEEVYRDMLDRKTLTPEQAVEYGLVHEIKEQLIEPGWELHSVQALPAQ
jgi:ATP-dependent Clp protease protease subunit